MGAVAVLRMVFTFWNESFNTRVLSVSHLTLVVLLGVFLQNQIWVHSTKGTALWVTPGKQDSFRQGLHVGAESQYFEERLGMGERHAWKILFQNVGFRVQ